MLCVVLLEVPTYQEDLRDGQMIKVGGDSEQVLKSLHGHRVHATRNEKTF